MFTCGDCVFYKGSSVSKLGDLRFCYVRQSFVSPKASACSSFRYGFPDKWECKKGSTVEPHTCLVCSEKDCLHYTIATQFLRIKKTLRVRDCTDKKDVSDILLILQQAISELNRCRLSRRYVHLPLDTDLNQLPTDQVCAVVNMFLDAVESVPHHLECDLPQKVVEVYNTIVSTLSSESRPTQVVVDDLVFSRTS